MRLSITKPAQVIFSVPQGFNDTFFISDKNGKVYYYRDLDREGILRVNIPHVGEYITSANFNLLGIAKIPIPKLPTLSDPDRSRVKRLKIVFDDALYSTPAIIYTEVGEIQYSPILKDIPVQMAEFIMFHEAGHCIYSKEKDADRFALASCMLLGNNRSMCYNAINDVLKDSNSKQGRLENILNAIQETQTELL